MTAWLKRIIPSLVALSLPAQAPLSIQDAIRAAWSDQSGLQAGQAMVDRARAESEATASLRLPTLSLGAGFLRTDEPMQAFGTRLDQARITQMDFLPAALNHPAAVTGFGASFSLAQPIYAGGRLDAARRAGAALARSEASSQQHRRQQVALAVAQAYFGAQVAEQAQVYAQDTLRQATETEHFVCARVDQGLLLASEGERSKAFRAQSQAGVAEARQRVASARSALALLMGREALDTALSTAIEAPAVPDSAPGQRADLAATRFQGEAAQAGVAAAQGSLKPEVGLNLSAGTARYAFNAGGNWTTASLGAKWSFSFSDNHRVQAARASARAAALELKWQEAQAGREVREARGGLATAQAQIAFAQVAVTASEAVRRIRSARHREGLLPLMEVLDAESGLSGARTLLLNSELAFRLSEAQLALALGQPIEGVRE